MGSAMGTLEAVKSSVDTYLYGWATGGIVGAAGFATLEYAVRTRPLNTMSFAALDGFHVGSQLGGVGAVSGIAMEYAVNMTR